MRAGKIVLLVIGSLIVTIGVALMFGGGALMGIDTTFTDDEGYLTSPRGTLERDVYAIVGEALFEGEWIWWYRHPTTVRIRMSGDRPLFLGIAPRAELEDYLSDVSYARIESVDFRSCRKEGVWSVEVEQHAGTDEPAPPASEPFWQASVQGDGTQTLKWRIEPGDWALAVMNADGSRGIDVTGTVAAEAPWLLAVGIGLLAAGVLLTGLGVLIVLLVARGTRSRLAETPSVGELTVSPAEYPLAFQAELTEPLAPALWLVKWFLLIPHFVVLGFLWCGFAISWILSLFAILFTGRYPRGLFDYNVGVLRWSWRVAFYGYAALATDAYPPFSLEAGGYPADLDVVYPERLSPGLALVKWWLLAVPHYLIVAVFQGGYGFYRLGLTPLLALFAGVTLLFTGRYPKDIFRLVVGMNRWTLRVLAYAALMTDEYPPFRLDA